MLTRRFALILGVAFLVVGILGFVPGITVMRHSPDLAVHGPGEGFLLGLFHVNLLHNLVHVLFGLWGMAASANYIAARGYSRSVAVIYFVLAIMGMISTANTWNAWGLVPLHGNDVWLHAVIAAVAAYFGFAVYAEDVERGRTSDTSRWNRPTPGV